MRKRLMLSAIVLATCLSGCNFNSVNETKTFLSFKYMMEDCADIHGQDNYKEVWFYNYHGESYKHLYNLKESYLDMKVEMKDSRAVGLGTLNLKGKDGYSNLDVYQKFEYHCVLTDTTGGSVVSNLDDKNFNTFVFCIYWCRLNMSFIDPETAEEKTLTLHFRGGTQNQYPEEFYN